MLNVHSTMDKTNFKIIETLKENSRLSIKEISNKIKIPITTVHYRLKSMMQKNAIKFTVHADRKFLERDLIAYIMVRVTPGIDHEQLFEEILKHDEVEEGAIITGDFDLIFLISVKDMNKMNDFVLKYLRTKKQVADTRTLICYNLAEK